MIPPGGPGPILSLLAVSGALAVAATADADASLAWRRHADAPEPVAEVATVVLSNRIVVIGGIVDPYLATAAVRAFDPASNAWSSLPPYPVPAHHVAAAVVDGSIYAFGGYVSTALFPGTFVPGAGPAGWPWTALAFRLAPGALAWTPISPLPEARAAHAAAAVDGRIAIVGGVGAMNEYASATWLYDPASDAYATAAPIPTPRDHLSVAVADGNVLAIAGRRLDASGWVDLAVVESFDPATGAWSALAPAPLGRGGHATGTLDGRVVIAGGEDAEHAPGAFDEVDAFDARTGEWTMPTRMTSARHGMGGATVGGRFFVVAGVGADNALVGVVESLGRAT